MECRNECAKQAEVSNPTGTAFYRLHGDRAYDFCILQKSCGILGKEVYLGFFQVNPKLCYVL